MDPCSSPAAARTCPAVGSFKTVLKFRALGPPWAGPRVVNALLNRTLIVGITLIVAGLCVAGAGFLYGYPQARDGLESAQAMYEAQGVTLPYNENGQLVDGGTPEGAQKIMDLLEKDFKYPVNHDNFDPNDPLVNTRDELMYEYATITYHVLHTSVPVTLTASDVPITYRDVTYTEAGTYNVTLEHYYAHLDRTNPIERQLRAAWSPLAMSITSALAGAHANQAAGEIAEATTLGMGGIGLLFSLLGAGMVWISMDPRNRNGPGDP